MNPKSTVFLISLLFLNYSLLQSQNESGAAKNVTYMEVGTNALISSVSFNYEWRFYSSDTEKLHLYGRTGLGAAAVFWGPGGLGAQGGLTMLTGKANNHFELSAGAFFGYERAGANYAADLFVLPLLDLGYRYQKPGKGFLFRAKVGILSFGIGLGYAF